MNVDISSKDSSLICNMKTNTYNENSLQMLYASGKIIVSILLKKYKRQNMEQ